MLTEACIAVLTLLFVSGLFTKYKLMGQRYRKYSTDTSLTGLAYVRYCIKYVIVFLVLTLRRYRLSGKKHQQCKSFWKALIPSALEKQIDAPQDLVAMKCPEKVNDAVAFQGADSIGNHVLVRCGRRLNGETEIWLILRLKDKTGNITHLLHPTHPATTMPSSSDSEYAAGGLRCEMREPMRRWRISYNGWLRKESKGGKSSQMVHVKFSFIWTAMTDVIDFNTDLSPHLIADCFAQESWSRQLLDDIRINHEDRYEQWGQMSGQVIIDGEESHDLVLRGMRDHCYGPRDWSRYDRYIAAMGYSKDGTFFHVGAVNIPNVYTRLTYGYVGLPSGEVYPVDQTSLCLTNFGGKVPPNQFAINFVAGGKEFIVQTQVHTESTVYNGKDSMSRSELRFYSIAINGESGEGFNEFEYRYHEDRPSMSIHRHPRVVSNNRDGINAFVAHVPLVVPLTNFYALSEDLCGGKGRQLAELIKLQGQFTVPDGLVVTNKSYELFLQENKRIDAEIGQLTTVKDSESLTKHCDSIRAQVSKANIPAVIIEGLERQLERLFSSSWETHEKLAVRSSAIGEDSEDSSSAGQLETILGVMGKEQLAQAILKCWSSQFTVQSITYRRQTGQDLNAGCGVVVQKLVDADVAGVLFTMDPVSGHPGRLVINANFGLGETVVSGAAEPDTIIVDRSYEGDLTIREKKLGSKAVTMKIDDHILQDIQVEKSDVCSLSDQQIMYLCAAGIEIENWFGGPRDVEFAFHGSKLYLLQARPITTHNIESQYELMHEFDSAVRADENQYSTTANVGEVMGGANRPLGISVAMNAVDKALQQQMVSNGIQESFHPTFQHCYTLYQNHIMLNLMQTLYKDPGVISDRHISELCVLGHPVENDHLDAVLQRFVDEYPKWRRVSSAVKVMKMLYSAYSDSEYLTNQYGNFDFPLHLSRTDDIYSSIEECFKAYCEVWRCHISSSGYSGFWYHLLVAMLASGKKDMTAECYSDIALLYSNCDQVVSADVPAALQKLAKDISDTIDPERFCSFTPDEALEWLRNAGSRVAGKSFNEFMDKHGHRCIREIDIYEKSWSEEPITLMPVLQNIVKSIRMQTGKKDVLSPEDAVAQLKTPLSWIQKRLLLWAVPKARKAVGHREYTKSLSIKVGHAIRIGYRKLATLLYQQGKLPEVDLLYFLTHYEIGVMLKGEAPGRLLSRAQRRRRVHPLLEKTRLPDIVVGYPYSESTSEVIKGTFLVGTPVSGGTIKAPIRVAVTLDEAQHIQRGEILVTHSTDIAWSVFFPLLSGVITELGGLLSHGAVAAREYGLPCLVSVKEATGFFKTGDIAVLDATAGRITRVEPSSSSNE